MLAGIFVHDQIVSILILDEPTSSLDTNSERQVMRALEQAVEDRTTLIIAGRLVDTAEELKILAMWYILLGRFCA